MVGGFVNDIIERHDQQTTDLISQVPFMSLSKLLLGGLVNAGRLAAVVLRSGGCGSELLGNIVTCCCRPVQPPPPPPVQGKVPVPR